MTNDRDTYQSAEIGYSPQEMVACAKCSKNNPPTRFECLYCGAGLELPESVADSIAIKPAAIETWEAGEVVVITSMDGIELAALTSAAALDGSIAAALETELLPLPIVRTTPEDAKRITERLRRAGCEAKSLRDGAVAPTELPARVRAIEFDREILRFTPFNPGSPISIEASAITAIVTGTIVTTSSSSVRKWNQKEGDANDPAVVSDDFGVIDIHTRDRSIRVLAHGFDFSCLGEQKTMIAAQNLKHLEEAVASRTSGSVIDRSYTQKMRALDAVWPRTVMNTSQGVKRSLLRAQRLVGESVSNTDQFTRYSLLISRIV